MSFPHDMLRSFCWGAPEKIRLCSTCITTSSSVNKMLGRIRLHSLSVSQSAEVLALKHESRILRHDECPRILLSCYRARNSGPEIMLLLLFTHMRHNIQRGKCLHLPHFSPPTQSFLINFEQNIPRGEMLTS